MIETNRRALITGLISLVAAPAIIRIDNLMPVKKMPVLVPIQVNLRINGRTLAHSFNAIIGDLVAGKDYLMIYNGSEWSILKELT